MTAMTSHGPTQARRRRSIAALLAAATLLTSGCHTSEEPAQVPEQVELLAADLATALATGEGENVRWAGTDPDLPDLLSTLTDVPRTVAVSDITEVEPDSRYQASLDWSWQLPGVAESWDYRTDAELTAQEDGWAVVWSAALVSDGLTDGAHLVLQREQPGRGEILDRDGSAIVTLRPVRRIGIDKTLLADADAIAESADRLAELFDLEGYTEQVLAAGPRAFVEAIVLRAEEADEQAIGAIPGARAIADELPLAPTSTWARPLLGRAGAATAEVVEGSDGAVVAGDLVGLSGLQADLDATLRGRPGVRVVAESDSAEEVLFEAPPVPGTDVTLSLDAAIQSDAEDVLADVDSPAGLVALQPSTGEVLAAASSPAADGLDMAMAAELAPGSTFKVVTALALLRAGYTPESVLDCTDGAQVGGRSIGNYPGYPHQFLGEITLTETIAQSCNSALINARSDLSGAALAAAARSLGMAAEPEGPPPGFTGAVPAEMGDAELAESTIGQGRVLGSPLTMATVAGSVAAADTLSPVLVLGPEEVADQPAAAEEPLTDDEATQLAEMMRAVVTGGTGTELQEVPGAPVHAKTGSAEAGSGEDYRVDSWMMAYQDDLAVAVLVQGGGHGAGVAGALVQRFLSGLA
ncbi:penicillin-binding transpeptidase domain-containing protein [Ruania albidiflava]|uniref:penicillin-binding transpeptidase domain-containing protein n=1 Tax=Ruania albidiflava TaxID=366586 RepID=UPI0023F081D5|nr:penicillin-binding transpeptidase domain-containing protein [Ruania albidiflava]